jgi:hypothetical protein
MGGVRIARERQVADPGLRSAWKGSKGGANWIDEVVRIFRSTDKQQRDGHGTRPGGRHAAMMHASSTSNTGAHSITGSPFIFLGSMADSLGRLNQEKDGRATFTIRSNQSAVEVSTSTASVVSFGHHGHHSPPHKVDHCQFITQ